MNNVIKGSSIPIGSFRIKLDDGSYLDLSTLTNVIVYVVSKRNDTILAKYSYNTKAGYLDLKIVSATKCSFVIPGSLTKNAPEGPLELQVYDEDTDSDVPVDGKSKYMGSADMEINLVSKLINAEA